MSSAIAVRGEAAEVAAAEAQAILALVQDEERRGKLADLVAAIGEGQVEGEDAQALEEVLELGLQTGRVRALYDRGYTSIGCAPCTRAVPPGAESRSGRWWWETNAPKECGIHCAIETGGLEHELHALIGEHSDE